jgi:hypothetical protein
MEPFPDTERAASLKRPFSEEAPTKHAKKIVKMTVALKSNFDQNSLRHAQARRVIVCTDIDN